MSFMKAIASISVQNSVQNNGDTDQQRYGMDVTIMIGLGWYRLKSGRKGSKSRRRTTEQPAEGELLARMTKRASGESKDASEQISSCPTSVGARNWCRLVFGLLRFGLVGWIGMAGSGVGDMRAHGLPSD